MITIKITNNFQILWALLFGCLCLSAPSYGQDEKIRKVNRAVAKSSVRNYDLSFLDLSDDFEELDFDVVGGKSYLLIIAVDKYNYWKPLKNAVKDARDIKRILVDRYGFEASNIYELYDYEVTPETVEEHFRILRDKGTNIDNLLIYYSGHGFYDSSFDLGYWVPYNGTTNSGSTSTFIPNDKIRDYIKDMNFQNIFMVADACFSGSLFKDEIQTKGQDFKRESLKSRWGLSSGNLEVVLDALVLDNEKIDNSPFAYFFIDFLQNNLQDRFSVEQLIDHVKQSVQQYTPQRPVGGELVGVGSEGGVYTFSLQGTKESEEPEETNTNRRTRKK